MSDLEIRKIEFLSPLSKYDSDKISNVTTLISNLDFGFSTIDSLIYFTDKEKDVVSEVLQLTSIKSASTSKIEINIIKCIESFRQHFGVQKIKEVFLEKIDFQEYNCDLRIDSPPMKLLLENSNHIKFVTLVLNVNTHPLLKISETGELCILNYNSKYLTETFYPFLKEKMHEWRKI